jgi:drug/metabolite transporter (DMT)-like permease
MRRPHLLAYIALCLIWGSTWLAIRICVQDVPPFLAAALRFFLAAAALFIWVRFRKPRWPRSPQQWNAILLLGFTVITIPYGLLFWAEQYVPSSLSAILFSAVPLVVALLTPLMLHRPVPRQAVRAMLIAFAGLLILLGSTLDLGSRAFWAGIAVLISMTCGAWSAVYAKLRLQQVDPVISTALQLLIGSIGLFWATWALEPHRHAVWTRSAVLALVFLASLGSAVAFALYYWLLQHMQPYQLSSINLVIPIVALLEGSLLGHEPVPLAMIAAMLVVLASVGVVLRTEATSETAELIPKAESETADGPVS